MNLSRRTLLTTVAPGAALMALAGCGTTLATLQSDWNAAVTAIQTAVSKYAGYIPTVETIAAEAAALFGPQYTALVAVGTAALNQIVATLVKVVSDLTPPAAARFRSHLARATVGSPMQIGVTPEGIAVLGYK